MPDFEKLTPEQSILFLGINAASPTNPLLQAMAEAWQQRRGKGLYPDASLWDHLPTLIRSDALLGRKSIKSTKEWAFSDAGQQAAGLLGATAGRISDAEGPELAPRLVVMLELVEENGEPYATMLERPASEGQRLFCEAFAAPLATDQPADAVILIVLNSGSEAM